MSLRYVFGSPGTGKSHFILNDIIERSNDDNKKLIFIVPEQFTLESEKQLVTLAESGCIIEPQVLSFNRLAYFLFSKVGKTPGKYLDETGKVMLLRKIIYDFGRSLKYFGKAADKQGFMDSLSQTVSEFYRYNISVESLDNQIKKHTETQKDIEKTDILLKLGDLRMIFNAFTEYISDKFVSTEETLDILADKIDSSDLLDGCEVWIDGFNGFTPQEFEVITCLLKKASRVTIAVLINESRVSYPEVESPVYKFYSDPFYETKKTINKLSRSAENARTDIEQPLLMQTARRYDNFAELKFLQKHFFSYTIPNFALKNENLFITRASDRYAELHHAARSIITLLKEKGYRYSDIAVLTGSMEDYEKSAVNIFKQYGIPVFIDASTDILAHPLAEMVRSVIDIAISNRSYETVFRFLKTGLTPIDREDIDYLENYVLAYGIKGYKWELEDWRYGFENGQYEKERVISCRNEFMAHISLILQIAKESGHTVRDITSTLLKILVDMKVPDTLIRWSDDMSATGNNEMSRRHSQIWERLMSIFEKMVEILGNETVSIRQYAKILEAGLKSTDMGIIPPSLEQVLIGDIERTRLPKIKALFLVGVNDGILPRIISEQGLLSDKDRVSLILNGMELAPDSRRRSFEENLLIYICFCKPEEKLYLSYTTGNLSGKSTLPSPIINKIKGMFPMLEETDAIPASEIIIAAPAPIKILDETLSSQSINKLYGNEIITSVSRLEKYAACPYAYFLQYNLNAEERKIYEIQPVDIGNFFHMILEHFTKYLEKEGISWRSLNAAMINGIVDICVAELTPAISSEALLSTERNKNLIKRVSRIAKKSIWALSEHIKSGNFEIYATELGFKYESILYEAPMETAENRRIILTGRIDRIDTLDCDNNRYVKIMDYKSGGKKFDPRDIYFGMQLQLILYLDIIIRNGKNIFTDSNKANEILPGGVFYFNIDDPIIAYKPGEDTVSFNKRAFEQFKMSGLALADQNVITGLDNNIDKKSLIIPVKTKGGELIPQSSLADIQGFNVLRETVKSKITSMTTAIFKGDIPIAPYKKDNTTACDYCPYSSVCGINSPESTGRFKDVPKP